MGMGYAPTWLRQVSPPPLLHKTSNHYIEARAISFKTVNCAESEHLLYSLNSFH